jgi:hypothetical protein
MRYTSINHCLGYNYQINHNTIPSFDEWCTRHNVNWAHLFDIKTGAIVASFDKSGLITHELDTNQQHIG